MNFTVDDADPTFVFSNGWAIQSDDDPDRDQFFQSTYHVATNDGATLSYQFQGSAFTLFGSKGPSHAQFDLQFDGTVVSLSAAADETAFRQELFSHTFSSNGTSAQHLVKLTAVLSGDGVQGKWLDVDYITFTSGTGTTTSIGTATVTPPWETESSSATVSSSSTSFPEITASSTPSATSKLPTILAIVFGAIIGVALCGLALYLVLRRAYDKGRARERAFRYGQSSVNPSTITGGGATYYGAPSSAPSAKTGVDFASPAFASPSAASALPFSPATLGSGRDSSLSSSGRPLNSMHTEMRSMSTDTHAREREATATPMSVTRPLISGSPIAWTRQKTRGDKGDADSLRTDFLQV